MTGSSGHIIAVLIGALAGGIVFWLFAPQVFWAGIVGGALLAGAVRVGLILFREDDR